jgi:hypothetical protein
MKIKIALIGVKELFSKISFEYNKLVQNETEIKKYELLYSLKLNTPIDTGYARSRWSISSNSDNAVASYKVSKGLRLKDVSFFINNDAPYITYLNLGHSKQAPAFFIEQTILSRGYKINNIVIT